MKSGSHKKMYHDTLPMCHGTSVVYHGTFSYGLFIWSGPSLCVLIMKVGYQFSCISVKTYHSMPMQPRTIEFIFGADSLDI